MARFDYEPPTESCRLVSALCRPGGCLLAAFSLPCAWRIHSMHNFIHTGPARLSNLASSSHLRMEARVGIERIPPSTSHSKSTAYGTADLLNLKRLHFMSRITPPDFFLTQFNPHQMKFAGTFAGTF